jgi:hypothetical protein
MGECMEAHEDADLAIEPLFRSGSAACCKLATQLSVWFSLFVEV